MGTYKSGYKSSRVISIVTLLITTDDLQVCFAVSGSQAEATPAAPAEAAVVEGSGFGGLGVGV